MRVLGIDPGATTGWCLYDTEGFVVACGTFREDAIDEIPTGIIGRSGVIVLERPVAHGPTRPQVVDCAWVAGQLWRDAQGAVGKSRATYLTRLEVRQALTAMSHGTVRVVNDATAWAALVLMHGEGSDRKPKRKGGKVVDQGGPLGEVKSHARAALAVAVAWWLRQQEVAANPPMQPQGVR